METGHSWGSDTSQKGLLPSAVAGVLCLENLYVAYLLKIMDLSKFRDRKQFLLDKNSLLLTSFPLMQHGENQICSYCLMYLAEESLYEPWNQILEH